MISPIMMLTTATTPKCTMSMPSAFAAGEQHRHDDQQDGRALEKTAEHKAASY